MTKEKTTLREFINYLEELSDHGKYDDIRVVTMDSDGECYDIGWYGFDTVYPQEEIDECNPQNGEKQKSVVIIPKFRIGDNIKTTNEEPLTITKIDGKGYWSEDLFICGFDDSAKWELVERKPTDKVEPKFKVGDWVVISTSDGEKVVQIDSIEYFKSGEPRYITSEGRWFGNGTKAHLWTIQDAKDGDVLFQDLMCGKTFIYNGVNPDMAILYSFIISNDGKDVLPYHIGKPNTGIGNIEENKNIIYPATKEQRDLLFQKIKEAGYEWDAEKKELKKIEQKPTAWSEKVDLEKEKDAYICNHFSEGSDGGMISDAHREIGGVTYFDLSNIAEHFFELGLKAKG